MTTNHFKSHVQAIAKLGLPIVVAQLGVIVQSFADTIMIGQYGTLELSSAAFVNNVFNLVFFFLLGYSYSTTPIVGYYYGKNDLYNVGKTLKESLLGNFVFSLIVCFLLYLLYLNIDILNQPSELLPYIKPYFLLLLISMPFVALFNSLKQFSDAIGDTKTPMWVMILGNILNIAGNALLIYGLMGCPEWGLFGAGLATLFSRIIMCGVMFWALRHKKHFKAYHQGFRSDITFSGVWHLTRVGLPISCQLSLEAAAFNVGAVFMGWLGAYELAAHQRACSIGTLCFTIYYGIGAAVAIRISHFRGRQDWSEVRTTSVVGFIMTLCASTILSGTIFFSMDPLVAAFTPDANVANVVYTLMPAFFVYQFGDSLQVIFANSLRAIEKVKNLLFYAVIAYGCVSIPLSYIFAFTFHLGAPGVWWAFPFGLTTAGLLFCNKFYKETKMA